MSPRTKSPRELARKAEKALGELSLSVTTQADKNRIAAVVVGMRAIDDEQADLKAEIDRLLTALATSGYSEAEVIEELRKMSKKWSRGK